MQSVGESAVGVGKDAIALPEEQSRLRFPQIASGEFHQLTAAAGMRAQF
jgi:hypothetical protein